MKLIILDRDGVINHDSDNYVKNANEWHAITGSIEAIAQLSKAGYTIAVATNQSGLSRGLFGLDELEDMHRKMCQLVEEAGGHIDGIFYCPHLPKDLCLCRKPATGLIQTIAGEFGADLHGVPLVGDSLKDLQAAISTGCRPILVRTGKGATTESLLNDKRNNELDMVAVFNNLASFVTHLLQTEEHR